MTIQKPKHNDYYNVSVIVPTYHSDINKLFMTLLSILAQAEISFEIIISDDGSGDFQEQIVVDFFRHNSFENYIMNINPDNKGTVSNILEGFSLSRGEYVACISPGDMFFCDLTLKEFYLHAKHNDLDICFGNAIHYTIQGEDYTVLGYELPKKPELYNSKYKIVKELAAHLKSNSINGTTYLRRREKAIKTLRWVSKYSKYVEDTPGLQYYLALYNRIGYLNKNYTWYEKGGISTSKNRAWIEIIDRDMRNTGQGLKEAFPDDTVVRVAFDIQNGNNKIVSLALGMIRNPLILLAVIYIRLFRFSYAQINNKNTLENLNKKIKKYDEIIKGMQL